MRSAWFWITKPSTLRGGLPFHLFAAKIGCSPATLHEWVKKTEVDTGKRAALPSDVAEKMKSLGRENRELLQAKEILRKASA